MLRDRSILKVSECERNSRLRLQQLCRSILQAASPVFRDKEIEACFYPYVGLTHTMRRRKDKWIIRISDHCRDAPQVVLEAIITILAYKVLRKKPDPQALAIYESFREDPVVAEAVQARRLVRGRKAITGEEGNYHSLGRIYGEINERYFNNQVEIRAIGWGIRPGRKRLAHYDPVHQTITLSPALDSPQVPAFVTNYIVYHEMLHALLEGTCTAGVKRYHTAEFRRAERAHPDYAKAKRFLKELWPRLRRSLS